MGRWRLGMLAVMLGGALLAADGVNGQGQLRLDEPETLFVTYCVRCHSLAVPLERRMREEEWVQTVAQMSDRHNRQSGREIPAQSQALIVSFLASGEPLR